MLNDVFVSGIQALVGLPVDPPWSHSFQYAHASACQSHAFGRASCFANFCSNVSICDTLLFILKNFSRFLHKLYFLNLYRLLVKTLSSLLNACYITSVSSLH